MWGLGVAVALDRGLNFLTGGDLHETVSTRAAKAVTRGCLWAIYLCRALHFLDNGHCDKHAND